MVLKNEKSYQNNNRKLYIFKTTVMVVDSGNTLLCRTFGTEGAIRKSPARMAKTD